MAKKLVIVESPAKARTIAGYLGSDYIVESSIGHIRDLPRSAADVPASMKSEPWSRLGVDVDNDFKPLYIVPADKKKQVTKLRKLAKESDEVFLATDEDREGESIAWHLLEVLNTKLPVHRMVFHEITPPMPSEEAIVAHSRATSTVASRRCPGSPPHPRPTLCRLRGVTGPVEAWCGPRPVGRPGAEHRRCGSSWSASGSGSLS